jgi:hypothetical protein
MQELSGILKATSASKWTSQTLSDKLALNRILRNLGMPQMPVHYINEGVSVNRNGVENFVLTHLCHANSTPVAMKPTHLSNGTGVIFVGRVAPEDGPQPTMNYLVHHLQKFLSQKSECSLRPGFLAQEKYDSVLGFDRPLELRLLLLWGKARLATWWWGHSNNPDDQPRNVWLARHLSQSGEFSSNDSWVLLSSFDNADPACCRALEIVLKQIPAMVALAETVAVAVGAPLLRADFFAGSERWGVRLNDVVYGSAIDYMTLADDVELTEDMHDIVQILQQGHLLCRRHLAPEHFLSQLGVRGHSYSDMNIAEAEPMASVEDMASTMASMASTNLAHYTRQDIGFNFASQSVMLPEQMSCDVGASAQAHAQIEAPEANGSGKDESKHDYKHGDEVEIWSKSQKVWSLGKIIKVGATTVTVSFTLPDGMLYAKELPPRHRDLRPVQPPAIAADTEAADSWAVGDEIEVWSNSRQQWGKGKIEKVELREQGDDVVMARFTMPDGSVCEKEMWAKCPELRRAQSSSSSAPAGSNSTPVAPRKRTLAVDSGTQEKVNTPSTQLSKPPVQRTSSYATIQPSAQNSATPQVFTATQAESYVPPPSSTPSQRSRSYVPPTQHAQQSIMGTQVMSTAPTTGVQRSFSYVPPTDSATVTASAAAAAPQKIGYGTQSVDTSAVQSNYSHTVASSAPPKTKRMGASQTVANSITSHAPAKTGSAASVGQVSSVSSYKQVQQVQHVQHVQSVQQRPASVPPRQSVPQKSTVMAPSWSANGHHYRLPPTANITGGVVQQTSAVPSQNDIAGNGLKVEELAFAHGTPDPTHPSLKSQVLARLGFSPTAIIKPMARAGGQNVGVWLLENFVLKLVRNTTHPGIPTETQRFQKLAAEHPTILSDPALTFPRRIFSFGKNFDLMVMPKASGERVSDIISLMWARGQKQQVMTLMQRAGAFLKDFHLRYGNKQHCDFQASNLFYDEPSGKFTMVDLADIGQQNQISERDLDRFIGGLRILGKSFGPQFFQESQRSFQAGYNSR